MDSLGPCFPPRVIPFAFVVGVEFTMSQAEWGIGDLLWTLVVMGRNAAVFARAGLSTWLQSLF